MTKPKLTDEQKRIRLELHKQKMARKAKRREMWYKSTPSPLVLANISVNHQDYGMSPAEHLRVKAERLKNNS